MTSQLRRACGCRPRNLVYVVRVDKFGAAMKHELEVDAENQWILVRFRGEIAEGDALALMQRAVQMPGWTPACDRIVVYEDDSDLNQLDVTSFERLGAGLAEFIHAHYGDTPSRSAQVCNDTMKRVLLEFWVNLTEDGYPAQLQLFDTVQEAKAWLLRERKDQDGRD